MRIPGYLAFVAVLKKTFPHVSMIARMTRLPWIGRVAEWGLFEGDDIVILPKQSVIDVGRTIDDPGSVAIPTRLLERFVEEAGSIWKMDSCICREAAGCEHYPVDYGCLFLGDSANAIHPALGRPVSKAEALEHLERCREAGLVHLVGKNKLDSVWLNARPGGRLLTVCSCCPCCCLWKILPMVNENIASKVTKLPGVEVWVNEECQGCGECAEEGACFASAIDFDGDRATVTEACRGCGRCVERCPNDAISIRLGDPDAVGNTFERLSRVVRVA